LRRDLLRRLHGEALLLGLSGGILLSLRLGTGGVLLLLVTIDRTRSGRSRSGDDGSTGGDSDQTRPTPTTSERHIGSYSLLCGFGGVEPG
jgi:hypothetical protein